MSPRLLAFSEYTSYAVGLCLIFYAGTIWSAGWYENRVATKSLETNSYTIERSDVVDVSDWSEKRVAAWRQTFVDDGPAAIGLLEIPSLQLSVPVFEDTGERSLNAGAGWVEGTDVPGYEFGNMAIAAHRDGYFRDLQHVEEGASVKLMTLEGEFTYQIEEIVIVDMSNIEPLLPQSSETLTLVTCYPFYYVGNAPQRFIVKAVRRST